MAPPVPETALDDLAARMADQHARLTANSAGFTYDRNGLRLGIAALQDELMLELWPHWHEHKKRLDTPEAAAGFRHEFLDIAAVAMLAYLNVPAEPARLAGHARDPTEN
jgi:hypothetical protein